MDVLERHQFKSSRAGLMEPANHRPEVGGVCTELYKVNVSLASPLVTLRLVIIGTAAGYLLLACLSFPSWF